MYMLRFDVSKRISVKFTKKYGAYKNGAVVECGLVLAADWVKNKVAKLTDESQAYVKDNGLEEMFGTAPAAEETEKEPAEGEKAEE